MSIRVSSNQMIYSYKKSLNEANERQDKYMEQGDGNKLHRPSDSSVDYTKWMRYETADTENSSYTDNVKTGISWMKTSDAALANMTDIQTTLKEKTTNAANSHNNTDDMQAIAKEMMAEIQELVSLGNTQTGDRYVFAGQSDTTQPFSMSEKEVKRGLAKTLDVAQQKYFSGAAGVDNATNRSLTQMLSMKGSDGNTYYLNTMDGNVYSKDFVDTGYKNRVRDDADAIVDPTKDAAGKLANWNGAAGTEKVSKYFKNTGEILVDAATGNPPSPGKITVNGQDVTLSFDTVSQKIVTYSGDDKYISMTKKNGTIEPQADTVNVTGPDIFGTDIFDDANSGNKASGTAMLNELLTVHHMVLSVEHDWLSSDGMTVADEAHATTVNTESKLGARQALYENVQTMLGNQNEVITKDITDVMATDVADLAVKLMEAQTVYNMGLALGARILPASLADYLS